MNRLQYETSPYLLQHAHNPVDWYAWSDEALERAQRENKPILVSIGYSTCHWCHVMERESFEDEAVADYMNRHFVNITIDREERPDLDQIYMEACQAIHGSGGWPLNCFLLPDGRPFFAGTYYPPEPAYNRPSWMQLLRRMVEAYDSERETAERQAGQLVERIEGSKSIFLQAPAAEGEAAFTTELADTIFTRLSEQYDDKYGGFGGAPKFPSTMALAYLLDYHHYTGKMDAWRMVEHSLTAMIRGGIYDQLGGGFARYATDRAWLVPHFEKMLYDNALLVELLSQAYRQQPLPIFQRAIECTLEFIEREMRSPEGGFYAALDADSEGVEGKFYVWSQAEVNEVLGADAALFSYAFGVTPGGNWEGHNILWQAHTSEETAEQFGLSTVSVKERLKEAGAKLLDYRAKRIRPGLDDKILLSWNALMVSALAGAYRALGNETYLNIAIQALRFLQTAFKRPEGGLYHTYKEGRARIDAHLDDYAFLIDALLDVYEITFDEQYIASAQTYTNFVLEHFLDKPANLFYFTSADQSDLPLRTRELYDNALPSGNATMALNLHRLAIITGSVEWNRLSGNMLQGIRQAVERYPTAFGRWARALLYRVYPAREVAIIGPAASRLASILQRPWLPNTVFMAAPDGDDRYPLLAGRHNTGETQIYVCREYACQLPITSVEQTWRLLGIGQMTNT